MSTLEIRNIGPIKEAKFDLNKVNVFMGPQSSGKSTIAKIISYCTWVEKRRILDGFFRDNFYERLITFHNLEETYFDDEAFFKYEGDYCSIEYSKKEKPNGEIIDKKSGDFKNSKHIYIPAERNFVASIPNLGRYKETNNSIMNFLYDWYEAKKHYSKSKLLQIPLLGISFYHIEEEDKDVVVLENGKEIILRNASSGIQSITPLYLLLDYLTDIIFQRDPTLSPFERGRLLAIIGEKIDSSSESNVKIIKEISEQNKISRENVKYVFDKESNQTIVYVKDINQELLESPESYHGSFTRYFAYRNSQFIIEEPEQNLFPSTQRDLVYHLLQLITGEKNHQLTITTHSPYILYALNNCMMGYLIKDTMPKEEQEELLSKNSWINPTLVSVWEIEDGTIRPIKNSQTGTVSKHYFNGIMNDVMEEYYDMLTYLKIDKHEG